MKLVFAIPEGADKNSLYYFILTYQFVFPMSYIYYFYSLPDKPKSFTESGRNLKDIESIIVQKYDSAAVLEVNFENIDASHNSIIESINFEAVYVAIKEQYEGNERFRDILDLYLYTVGNHHKLYNNLFQKIAQLQTIFESLIGEPKQEQKCCGYSHYIEPWAKYIERELEEIGIGNKNYRDLIVKIKSELNSARAKYTHKSAQYNIFAEFIKELRMGNQYDGQSPYMTNFNNILNNTLEVKNWSSIDWENVYRLYQIIIAQLIYFKFLKVK